MELQEIPLPVRAEHEGTWRKQPRGSPAATHSLSFQAAFSPPLQVIYEFKEERQPWFYEWR